MSDSLGPHAIPETADSRALARYLHEPDPEAPVHWTEIEPSEPLRDMRGRCFEGLAEGRWHIRLVTFDARIASPSAPEGARGVEGAATNLVTKQLFRLPFDLAREAGIQAEATIDAAAGLGEDEYLALQSDAVPDAEPEPAPPPREEGKLVPTKKNKKAKPATPVSPEAATEAATETKATEPEPKTAEPEPEAKPKKGAAKKGAKT